MKGHNERSFRLDALVEQARRGLHRVAAAEADTLEGWLTYGAALNEGRTLFRGDREFGGWVTANALRQLAGAEVEDHERAAAMWAAANLDQLEDMRNQFPQVRTIRGLHAKWKEIEAERERAEEEARRKAEAEAKAGEQDPARKSSDTSGADKAETSVANGAAGGSAPEPSSTPDMPKATDEDSGSGDDTAAPAPDPYGYADLTEEALLDLANGLRAQLEEERAGRKKAEAEVTRLKGEISMMVSAGDQAEVVRRQAAKIKHLQRNVWKANEEARRAMAAKYRAEKRAKELENAERTL